MRLRPLAENLLLLASFPLCIGGAAGIFYHAYHGAQTPQWTIYRRLPQHALNGMLISAVVFTIGGAIIYLLAHKGALAQPAADEWDS